MQPQDNLTSSLYLPGWIADEVANQEWGVKEGLLTECSQLCISTRKRIYKQIRGEQGENFPYKAKGGIGG